ncbi:phosphoenolpyruvate carboxykinase (ATP) [Patescibacteria group bacterium]|nr:phosphoenolpyruvate carboxykinase (ATP) [Patescibacteria group bacterium]
MIDGSILRNLSVGELVKKAVANREVTVSKSGALVVYTGKYTGRSPNDKFIVDSPTVHEKINWGKINLPISANNFEKLHTKIAKFFSQQKEIYLVDCLVGAQKQYQLKLRVYCQYAYQALFATHLFRQPEKKHLTNFEPDLTLYCAPSVQADPKTDGTNSETFIVLDPAEKKIIIGGSKYAGEIKKSVFTYMNYLLPQRQVFPMHCSANVDDHGNTALFFGLSGTGKTTLSADPKRRLIGDDEHGWSSLGIFNFEGGCYAKCIRINKQSEPQIWAAIHRKGSLTENVVLKSDNSFDFDSDQFTENTRAVYPLTFINNSLASGVGRHPKYVIFLTADASGVLPPVAHLTLNQAAYHFLSGYTSKLAGTERGIKEPKPTFSAYFGAPFMPLKPMVYLNLLKKYLKKHETRVFLVNTGWTGGPYGIGSRISIKVTRKIIEEILSGQLNETAYRHDKIFNLYVPENVGGVDKKILEPSLLWNNKDDYLKMATKLSKLFIDNMKQYPSVYQSIINSGPNL